MRVPVVATLDALDEEALVQILQEPKDAITMQYRKFLEYDGVELIFQDAALKSSYRREPEKMRDAAARHLPTYVIKSNTYAQIAGAVREMFQMGALEEGDTDEALPDAEEAIQRVLDIGEAVEFPRDAVTADDGGSSLPCLRIT